jgi:hypothetical protein
MNQWLQHWTFGREGAAKKSPLLRHGPTVVASSSLSANCSTQWQPLFAYFLLAWTKSRASGGTRLAGFDFGNIRLNTKQRGF